MRTIVVSPPCAMMRLDGPPADLAVPTMSRKDLSTAAAGVSSLRGGVAIWKELAAPSIREIYPVVRDTVHAVGVPTADLNLGVWPEWFRPPAPDDPPQARMCGFVFDPVGASQQLSDRVESFLAAGDAPVVAGFGSAASLHAAERYRVVAAACEKLGRRCLLIGSSADAVAPRPALMVVPSAPYARVFPALRSGRRRAVQRRRSRRVQTVRSAPPNSSRRFSFSSSTTA